MRKLLLGLAVVCCISAAVAAFVHYWTPPWVVADLSMRFTHPELYQSRDGLPMYTALYELRQRGLLHRGMAEADVHKLLGEPPHKDEEFDPGAVDPSKVVWVYYLHASSLAIEFAPDGTALSFTEVHDGDEPRSDIW